MNRIGWIAVSAWVIGCGGQSVESTAGVDHGRDAGAGGARPTLGAGGLAENGGTSLVDSGGIIPVGPLRNVPDAAPCTTIDTLTAPLSPSVLLLVDRASGWSGDGGAYWSAVRDALVAFANEPHLPGDQLALGYFPSPPTADAGACSVGFDLAVPMSLASTAARPIADSVLAQVPAGPRALVPALASALEYANSSAFPKRVVIITGGESDCSTDPTTALSGVVRSYSGVTTTLLGVGPGLSSLASLTQPFAKSAFVETADPAKITQALAELADEVAPCKVTVAPPSHGYVDASLMKVTITTAVGSHQPVYFVNDVSGCTQNGGEGWYYDTTADPPHVVLCDASCTEAAGRIRVAIGCPIRVTP